MELNFSLYENNKSYNNTIISVENYIGFIEHGRNQDLVLKARILKQKGDKDGYTKLKNTSRAITGSCVFESGKEKNAGNIKYMNGLILLDIDEEIGEEKYHQIKNDRHTMIVHRSFGGVGYCVFIKIDPNRFEDSFCGLQEYYHNVFDVDIDPSCSNKNRLRYVSYDPEIYHNTKSIKFTPKEVKRFKAPKEKETNYIFHEDDFDNILRQIRERSLDLCQDDYFIYVRIGMALASKFGHDGLERFKFICSFGSKYKERSTERDYSGFVRRHKGASSIGTFYYYCKQANIELYSEKTKVIINKVKVGKSQGKPTVESIASNLSTANSIIASPADLRLIGELIESKQDFSKEANEDLSEIEQIESFIIERYSPTYDSISKSIILDSRLKMGGREFNDIYVTCKKVLDLKIPKDDIRSVLNSNSIPKINYLENFFRDNIDCKEVGLIEEYAMCIYPQSEFNVWALKKWLVGAIHNWTFGDYDTEASPATLVLTGQDHGVGKTTWIRNILPKELRKYHTQEKIDSKNKDSVFRMCTSLVIYDDEFGGDGFKDVKAFKALSDMVTTTQRRPYASEDDVFTRMAMLCGSTNELDVLRDMTGNRRILPINVERIDYDRVLSLDKISMIMEAYNLYNSGFNWKIRTKEDVKYIKDHTENNEVILPFEEIFFNNFALEQTDRFTKEVVYNQGEILEYITSNSSVKPNKFDIKEVLVRNKLAYKVHRVDNDKTKKGIKLYRKFHTDDITPTIF